VERKQFFDKKHFFLLDVRHFNVNNGIQRILIRWIYPSQVKF